MAGATQAIDTLRPVTRQQGTQIPNLMPAPRWIDAVALLASTAATYTFPADSTGAKGTILGINATTGPVYYNFAGTAVVQAATETDGAASGLLRTDTGASYILAVPAGATSVSLICASACVVSIEVWK